MVALPLLSPEIVGECRFVRLSDRPDTADLAVTVVDAWQGRGVSPRSAAPRLTGCAGLLGCAIGRCAARPRDRRNLVLPARLSRDPGSLVS